MEVEFALTEDDIIAFQRYRRANPPGGSGQRTRFKVYGVIIYCFLVFLFVFDVSSGKGAIHWEWVAQWAALLGLPPLLFIFGPRYLDWANRKALRKDPRAFGLRRVAITPEALETTGALSAGTTLWLAVEKIAATRDHVFFQLAPTSAHIVPRHAFEDEEEYKRFVDTARRYHDTAKSGGPAWRLPPSTDTQVSDDLHTPTREEGILPKGQMSDKTEPRP